MTWVTWRQHRASMIAAVGALSLIATILVVNGLTLRASFERLGLDACAAPASETCPGAAHQFQVGAASSQLLVPLLLVVPALTGVFWGAPLVARELEQGTYRLAWMQSISRRRWLLTKVGVLGLATIVVVAITTIALNWWAAPHMAVRAEQFEAGYFDLLGVAPLASGLLALTLGVAAGTVTRRVLPAIALCLLAFIGVRVLVATVLRPHYMEPVSVTVPYANPGSNDGKHLLPADIGWSVSVQTLDATGLRISDGVGLELEPLLASCPELVGVPEGDAGALDGCAERMGFHVRAVYQPTDRYWRFQLTEASILLALSTLLVVSSLWWINRRNA